MYIKNLPFVYHILFYYYLKFLITDFFHCTLYKFFYKMSEINVGVNREKTAKKRALKRCCCKNINFNVNI